jgi:putative superfamily III holin-X
MSVPGVDKAAEQSVGDLAQTMSEQALVLVRQEVARARREMTAKAREASTGAAMVGGAALLGTLAAGTGTAALVLLLARRPEPSGAALGVTGLYAGAGALLARQGVARLRAAAPPVPEETVKSVKKDLGSRKRPPSKPGTRSAAKRASKAAARAKKP